MYKWRHVYLFLYITAPPYVPAVYTHSPEECTEASTRTPPPAARSGARATGTTGAPSASCRMTCNTYHSIHLLGQDRVERPEIYRCAEKLAAETSQIWFKLTVLSLWFWERQPLHNLHCFGGGRFCTALHVSMLGAPSAYRRTWMSSFLRIRTQIACNKLKQLDWIRFHDSDSRILRRTTWTIRFVLFNRFPNNHPWYNFTSPAKKTTWLFW